MARIGAVAQVSSGKIGFFRGQLRRDWEIGANKVAVGLALQRHIFKTELEAGDFAFLCVGNQPVVSISTVVAVAKNAGHIVDGGRILHGFSRAHELRYAGGVETVKTGNSCFGDDDAGGVHGEVITAVNERRQAVHNKVIALRRNNVEHHGPASSIEITGPVIVCDYDAAVFCVATYRHESAAVVRGGYGWQ